MNLSDQAHINVKSKETGSKGLKMSLVHLVLKS